MLEAAASEARTKLAEAEKRAAAMLSHLAAAVSRDRALEAATAPAAATLDDGRGEQGEAGRQRAGASAGGEKLGTRGGGEVERGCRAGQRGRDDAQAESRRTPRVGADVVVERMAFDRMAPTFFSVTLSASMASRLAASASRYSARSEADRSLSLTVCREGCPPMT